jgi:hypothetical protein
MGLRHPPPRLLRELVDPLLKSGVVLWNHAIPVLGHLLLGLLGSLDAGQLLGYQLADIVRHEWGIWERPLVGIKRQVVCSEVRTRHGLHRLFADQAGDCRPFWRQCSGWDVSVSALSNRPFELAVIEEALGSGVAQTVAFAPLEKRDHLHLELHYLHHGGPR